ncbi:MAG: hypothetical protein ACRCV9_05845 [Burkholderiaceae bacterium]
MNESAFKLPLLALVCIASGAIGGWVYRDRSAEQAATKQAVEANKSLVSELSAVKDAAPAIALQIAALQKTAATSRKLNDELANNRELLVAMADCPVPERLHRLSLERTDAINSSVGGAE